MIERGVEGVPVQGNASKKRNPKKWENPEPTLGDRERNENCELTGRKKMWAHSQWP